jgi:hypothetical protein
MYCSGLGLAQRVEVKARDHALRQLLQLRAGQHLAQLGLADQHDLQQLALAGFQVGQQAQLLQHVGAQVLCLVDDQHAALAGRVALQQEGVQRVDVVLDRGRARIGRGTGMWNSSQTDCSSSVHRELGVEDVGHVAVRRGSAPGSSGTRWSCRRRSRRSAARSRRRPALPGAATPYSRCASASRWRSLMKR